MNRKIRLRLTQHIRFRLTPSPLATLGDIAPFGHNVVYAGNDILVQFLAEALLLSTSGGLIGILLGVTASVITAIFADWPLIIPLNLIIMAFLSAFIIGVFFGVYPAKRAASLDPIKALQFE